MLEYNCIYNREEIPAIPPAVLRCIELLTIYSDININRCTGDIL